VEEAINQGRDLVATKACYDFRPIKIFPPDSLEVQGGFVISSRKVCDWMAGCEGLYLMVVTMGAELDAEVARLSKAGDMTRAFLLNAYGAEAAEALMGELNIQLSRKVTSEGLALTKRYSPGYGDWPVTAQRELLGFLQADKIGIKLTESCLMIPEKSVSAIAGIRSGNNEGGT
jgi:cobalamin-dependent methionine synthase I